MHLFLMDFDLKKELHNNSFHKITSTAISTDHTFKVSKNIGFTRKVDGKFVKRFENSFIVLSDSGEVMTWRLARSTAFAEIEDHLSGLKQRRDNVQLTHVYVDDCCRVRKKYKSVFGSVEVLLDLFHVCHRITSVAKKCSALYVQFCRVWIDF